MTDRAHQQEEFNQRICAFIERYAPRSYEGRDMEYELRGIVMQAMELAQAPFVYELKAYRDATLASSLLRPLT